MPLRTSATAGGTTCPAAIHYSVGTKKQSEVTFHGLLEQPTLLEVHIISFEVLTTLSIKFLKAPGG